MPQQITGHFTCDNSYSIWMGNVNGVVTKLLEATNHVPVRFGMVKTCRR